MAGMAPYVSYVSTYSMSLALMVVSAVVVHLWPTRTAQWRTLVWLFVLTGLVGVVLLPLVGASAPPVAAVVGAVFVGVRANQNGRKFVGMVRDWWWMR